MYQVLFFILVLAVGGTAMAILNVDISKNIQQDYIDDTIKEKSTQELKFHNMENGIEVKVSKKGSMSIITVEVEESKTSGVISAILDGAKSNPVKENFLYWVTPFR